MNKLHYLLALLLALGIVACDDDDDGDTTQAGEEMAGEAMAGEAMAGEAMAGETMAGEAMAGEAMAGEAMTEITCEMQCGDFANCAVSDCAGYDEEDRQVLFNGCMEVCEPSPMIAGVYAMFPTCEEKLDFAARAREGFSETCAGGGEAFCYRYSETCGEWMGETACIDWYESAEAGDPENPAGATQACYDYHLSVAAMEDPDLHCTHAAGAAPCSDEAPVMPSERAVSFCESYTATCGEWTSDTPCEEWFDAAAPGTEGDDAGATQACYEYHLGVAMSMEPEVHCPHAAGAAPCVDEAPFMPSERAVSFCASYTATCGDWADDTPCEEWFDAAEPGTEGDDSGATQACYEYHLGVAMSMEPEVHCPHAAGAAPCE